MNRSKKIAQAIRQPSTKTLAKYGLSELDWARLCTKDPMVCGVCEKLPKSGRLCIDHEHVKGWKKMAPEKRRQYVRGLLCWRCNYHFAGKGMDLQRSLNLYQYMGRYVDRRRHEVFGISP
jgi:Recombination endonuclease VII